MSAVIVARRGERIVPDAMWPHLVDRMNARLDAIASEADVDEDLATAVLEDLDFEPRCRVQGFRRLELGPIVIAFPTSGPCDKPARWMATCRTCANVTFSCNEHHLASLSLPVFCIRCNATGAADEVMSFIQMGGA